MQEQSLAPLARMGVTVAQEASRRDVRGRSRFDCVWGELRSYEFRSEAQELEEGYLLNHVVGLHLGEDSTWESNFDGRGWEVHTRPHHGVGVLPAEIPYRAREPEETDYLIVEIPPDFVTRALGESHPRARIPPVLEGEDPFVKHVLLALAEAGRLGTGGTAVTAESLCTALVAHLAKVPEAPARATIPSARLRRVLAYVAEHLDAPLTLQSLADIAEMDYYRFVRAFKQATGSSPHKYVIEARIARAKELLLDPELSITEIALQTGFATPSHFSVTFRRHTNQTPRSYRGGLR